MAVLVTFGFAGVAHAEKKVDWSQYLEDPGDRPTARPSPKAAEPAAKAKQAPRAKTAKVRSAKVASTKAKRKPARRR